MVPAIEGHGLLVVLYWLILFLIATYILVYVTTYFTGEGPGTFVGAARTTLLVGVAVFLVYDGTGYLFALMMQDPTAGIRLPPHYTYWDWLREPLALKWHVLGFVPFVRYVPVVTALVAGGVLQVVLWKIPYHLGAVVFLAQLFLTLLAMTALSFVFALGLGVYARLAGPPGAPPPATARPGPRRPARRRPGKLRRASTTCGDGSTAWGRTRATSRAGRTAAGSRSTPRSAPSTASSSRSRTTCRCRRRISSTAAAGWSSSPDSRGWRSTGPAFTAGGSTTGTDTRVTRAARRPRTGST
jgi:hypothetical protein